MKIAYKSKYDGGYICGRYKDKENDISIDINKHGNYYTLSLFDIKNIRIIKDFDIKFDDLDLCKMFGESFLQGYLTI